MHTAYLLLGGNLGDRSSLLEAAVRQLALVGRVEACSRMKETEPWGFDQPVPMFLNQVVVLQTELGPEELLTACQQIEQDLGRQRPVAPHAAYQSRTMDIDILLYDTLVCRSATLSLPHPRLHQRAFALELLAQVF